MLQFVQYVNIFYSLTHSRAGSLLAIVSYNCCKPSDTHIWLDSLNARPKSF